MIPLYLGLALFAPTIDFYGGGPYDSAVPRPEAVLGYRLGDRVTNFRDQERVFTAISESCRARVKVIEYGKTPEGRPLRIYAVTSPENLKRLESIRVQHAALASGKGDPNGTIPIVWVNECIHGNEPASFEAAMATFYNLAASRSNDLSRALEKEVVMLNPCYNPDGHERFAVYSESVATGSSDPNALEAREPGVIYGRLNHYRFDLNRDRVAFSQDETKAEFAETQKWNPQVYIDQHGQVKSYFFPPEPMSVNVNVDRARNAKWTGYFGKAIGKSFDSVGMSYFVKDTFDLYYPGYLDASNTLSGAIGMTHETDGGPTLAQLRKDGSSLTLRRGIEKHFTSAVAVIEAAAAKSTELLADYAKFKADASQGKSQGNFQRVVLSSSDRRPLSRLKRQLEFAGIHSYFAQPFHQADTHDYWTGKKGAEEFPSGSLVIDLAQPQGALAKALLEPGQNFEAEFVKEQNAKKSSAPDGEKYPGPDSPEFYDFTGWSLPYAHELDAWWCESAPPVSAEAEHKPAEANVARTTAGYAIRYSDQEDALCVFDALQGGIRAMITTKPMKLNGQEFAAGTYLFLAERNDVGYGRTLEQIANRHGSTLVALSTSYPDEDRTGPGSESTADLVVPSIAVVMGSGDRLAQSGAIWFLLERVFHLPFAPITQSAVNEGQLSNYTCVIVPEGATLPHSEKVLDWLRSGKVVVSLGSGGWTNEFTGLTAVKGDFQSLPGSLFKASLDTRSFLSYGYDRHQIAVPIQGSTFFSKKKDGGSAISLDPDEKASKLLSGWEWPTETEKALAGTVFLHDEPIGNGHFIEYLNDPTERAMWPGLYKTLLNAILIGGSG